MTRPRPQGAADLRPKNLQISPAAIAQLDDDDDSFCSKKSFYFLIPPKQSVAELVTLLVLAPLYGFFATYLCHPATSKTAIPHDEDEADMCSILAIIVVFFSSYSLLSGAIPEVTPYGTDDSFNLFSHHY